MIRVHIAASGRHIEPFGDPAAEIPIQNRPLGEWQKLAIAVAGLELAPTPTPPCLVIPDNLFASGGCLRAFVDGAAGRDAVLVLADSVFARRTTPLQQRVVAIDGGYRFDDVRFVSGSDAEPVAVVVDPDEKVVEIPLPVRYTDAEKLELSLPRHPVMTLHHWAHILWVNQAAGAMTVRATPRATLAARVAWAVLRSLSINRWKVLGRLNRIGRKCDIHPTAVVEGSTIGDGVTIGPFARVLFSNVGDGALVMAGAQVEASVLGPRSMVAQATVLRLCVLYDGAVAGQQVMQQCVLGRGAITTLAAYSIDLNFDRDVRVPLDGTLQSTGTRFLGAAFGHGCRIGTGLWLASGRMIPNGCFVVRHPSQVIQRVPVPLAAGVALANDDGTLRPVDPPRPLHG